MGAEQSAPRADGQTPVVAVRKTCYYEVLGVDRQVADDEIRKAYKKKALELHPDRNINDTENATRKFAEVQTAYEILSDPQERAWYDSHRDAILGGDPDVSAGAPSEHSGAHYTSSNAIFTLMSRFNSSVPMNDSPSGFFGILNAFFDQLAAEEAAACEWDGITPTDYPPFGQTMDQYESVAKPFYNVWSSFSTKKSFSWKDRYRLSDAPDRRIRRLMEKENKKFRDEGIREFNDAVLSLVTFVKRRDPRYVPNTQSEAERQRILRNSAAAQAARARAAHQEKLAEYTLPEWAQSRNDGDLHNDEFSLSEEDSEVEHIECVVCNKTFKSENQFETHEKSKKHIKAVQQIRRQMKKENADFDLEASELSPPADPSQTEDPEEGNANQETQVSEDRAWHSMGEEGDEEPALESPNDTEDDEYAPRSAVEDRIVPKKGPQTETTEGSGSADCTAAELLGATLTDMALDDGTSKKVGKAKLKREKKAARQAVDAQVQVQESHNCAVCKESFTSRTKLFSHIKEFNHAAPVPKVKGGKKSRR
ncbi:hypothetical protein B0H66DRAFT_601558 [Apodospora peruviana]|uniref:Uncharacterized protein n=1 Tax=Apodospora peruviana TaxID=516989 RepID=A0AAE0M7F5_9PEZI|nr:hypothetical protein B0H66DRAFT_601558 [Apodospora peruviana]